MLIGRFSYTNPSNVAGIVAWARMGRPELLRAEKNRSRKKEREDRRAIGFGGTTNDQMCRPVMFNKDKENFESGCSPVSNP